MAETGRRWLLPLVVAVAVCSLVVAVALLVGQNAALSGVVREQNGRLIEEAHALRILSAPDTRVLAFGDGPGSPNGRVLVNPSGVLLIGSNLPQQPDGRVYEMWLVDQNGGATPAGLFNVRRSGHSLYFLRRDIDVNSLASITVTLERSGGRLQPSGAPVISVALR